MSHQHLEVPRFPRGFVLSERPIDPPPTFTAGPILDNFYVHPWTNVETAGDANLFVIILGHAVPTRPEQVQPPAEHLLACLDNDEATFLKALDDYGGRHAIIFGRTGNIGVVNDATGMRSVFYAADGGVVASHAVLVEHALGGHFERDELPTQYGYPGNLTPYPRTKTLTANTYYWMTTNVVRRFWPLVRLAPRTVESAAEELLEKSVYAFQAISQDRPVRLTLTAGLDSRTSLAIALYSGVPFETYTYGDNDTTAVDRGIADDLAAQFGLTHAVISERTGSSQLAKRLQEVNYQEHHSAWVESLLYHYDDPTTLAVLGNTLEVGRSNSMAHRKHAELIPSSAEGMARLHFRRMKKSRRNRIVEAGVEPFMNVSTKAFQTFIYETSFDLAVDYFNSFDLFYWEYRMSTWQGHAMNERDFYSEPFIPFNIRSVFEAMLGVPEDERYADEVVYRMIEMVDPAILDLPINPKRWSRKKVLAKR